jgi:hypothetical protein
MEFVSFEIAKKLKEKGFREKCLAYYDVEDNVELLHNTQYTYEVLPCQYTDLLQSHNTGEAETQSDDSENCVDAPTIFQVFKWLRKEKKIFITINIGYCYESYEGPFPTNPLSGPILKGYYYGVWDLGNLNDKNGRSEYFESPELAALAGIEFVLENLI